MPVARHYGPNPDVMHPTLYATHQYVTKHQLLDTRQPVLLSFSTGPDSVFLYEYLRVAYANPALIYLVYFNHHARPSQAIQPELNYMQALKHTYPDTVFIQDAPVCQGAGLEVNARNQRYTQLANLARQHAITQVCTAHHYDDHIETILMNFIRGSRRGLSGIRACQPWQTGQLIRPLLSCKKASIQAYLDSHHIYYCTDHTNQDTRYTRNRIRHDVLPLLDGINPSIRKQLARFAQTQASITDFLDTHHRALYNQLVYTAGPCCWVNRLALCDLPELSQHYILRYMADYMATREIASIHITTAQTLANQRSQWPKYTQWPGHISVTITYQRVCITRQQSNKNSLSSQPSLGIISSTHDSNACA